MHNTILAEVSLEHELATTDFARQETSMEKISSSEDPSNDNAQLRAEKPQGRSHQAVAKLLASQYTDGIVENLQSILRATRHRGLTSSVALTTTEIVFLFLSR